MSATVHPTRTGATGTRSAPGGPLVGTGRLLRLALRRDRVVLPVWLAVIALIPAGTVGAYEQLYPTRASRAALTAGMGDNPAITMLYGPAFDLSTAGGFTAWRYGTLLPIFLGLVCVFTVVRHTRQEEDTGRQELLASTVIGRYAPLTASIALSGGFALVAGLVSTSALIVAGMPVPGSLVFGFGLASVSLVFTGVAAVSAQLAEYSRTANGIAGAALGIAFALRAVGDSATDLTWLSWLSPIGWGTQVRAFADDRYEVLLIPLAVTSVLVALAYRLRARRDIGLGLLRSSAGPATASPSLRTSLALATRLHRGTLLGWLTGFAVLSALFGTLASDIGDVLGENEDMRQILARMGGSQGVIDSFLASTANLLGMVAALFAVQAAVRLRSEETALRAEPLLTTGLSRPRWLAGHLVFVVGGSAALMLVSGLCLGLAHGVRVGEVGSQSGPVLLACLVQLPAVWIAGGAAVALFGLAPRYTGGAWAVTALFLLLSMFGPVLNLDEAVLDLSPFQHVPTLPSAEPTVAPLLWLMLTAAALLTVGTVSFQRRDIG